MDTEAYRKHLRAHFVGKMSQNSKFPMDADPMAGEHMPKPSPTPYKQTSPPPPTTAQQYKELTTQNQQKLQDYNTAYRHRMRNIHHRSSGGDADRQPYASNATLSQQQQSINDSYCLNSQTDGGSAGGSGAGAVGVTGVGITMAGNNYRGSTNYAALDKELTELGPVQAPKKSTHRHPHHRGPVNSYMYETDTNHDSSESCKSAKTIVTKRSSCADLRNMVKSQCKLHEVIDQTLKQMCSSECDAIHLSDEMVEMDERRRGGGDGGGGNKQMHRLKTLTCKRCTNSVPDKALSRGSSQKDVMTEIAKGDFLDCRSGETLTISVDDVVNSKVINPMIRKLQRMYLNNLKDEMSLMEDLERLPHKVNEVYKATIFKQKD